MSVNKNCTLLDLKQAFEYEEGIEPDRQIVSCGPVVLEDNELPLSELLQLNDNTLDILLPEAADPEVEVQADHDISIVTGSSKYCFQKIRLAKDNPMTVDLPKGNLGIVTQTNVDANGKEVYTVDRYKFQEEEEAIQVVLKLEAGCTVAYKMIDGREVKLTEKETKSFQLKTAGERALEKVQAIGQFLGNVGRFLRGVGELGNTKHFSLANAIRE